MFKKKTKLSHFLDRVSFHGYFVDICICTENLLQVNYTKAHVHAYTSSTQVERGSLVELKRPEIYISIVRNNYRGKLSATTHSFK